MQQKLPPLLAIPLPAVSAAHAARAALLASPDPEKRSYQPFLARLLLASALPLPLPLPPPSSLLTRHNMQFPLC
eukprot:3600406-Rhodomonas_salina.2